MARAKATDAQKLIETAARLFQKKGYANTTIDDLAAAAGISKPTVYQYVKSKRWLLESIFNALVARLEEEQDRIILTHEDPMDRMKATVVHYVLAAAEQGTYFQLFFGEQAELSPAMQRKFRAWGHEMTEKFLAILEDASARGWIREDVDLRVAANLTLGMLTSVARWYDKGGPLGPEEVAEQAMHLIHGLFVPNVREPQLASRARA